MSQRHRRRSLGKGPRPRLINNFLTNAFVLLMFWTRNGFAGLRALRGSRHSYAWIKNMVGMLSFTFAHEREEKVKVGRPADLAISSVSD